MPATAPAVSKSGPPLSPWHVDELGPSVSMRCEPMPLTVTVAVYFRPESVGSGVPVRVRP
jgi:hypothetical protein